jgi:uncharacterized membrane protein
MSAPRRALAGSTLGPAAVLLAPGAARACAVCAGQDEAVGWVMFVSSLALSMLPLVLIAGGVWYLRRRARQLAAVEAAEEAQRAVASPRRTAPAARTA